MVLSSFHNKVFSLILTQIKTHVNISEEINHFVQKIHKNIIYKQKNIWYNLTGVKNRRSINET